MSNQIRLGNGQLLACNTILNLIGHAAPFVVAIFAIAMLVPGLGVGPGFFFGLRSS